LTFLIMEFLGDETLLDYITEREQADNSKLVNCGNLDYFMNKYEPLSGTCAYISDFNTVLKKDTGKSYILNDMNLRNFLKPGSKIHRVDFEDCRQGMVEEDFGKFIAFLLTYNPAYTSWKIWMSGCIKELCKISLNLDTDKIDLETARELKCMKERRQHIF